MKRIIGSTLLAALAAAVLTIVPPAPAADAAPRRPNVIILMLDDQRYDKVTAKYMPNTYRRIISSPDAVAFENAFAPNPLCCPSRTTTLTGLYSGTTGIWYNGGQYGGWRAFHKTRFENRTIALDFQRAGYRTALIGKYLNRYGGGRQNFVPKGWDKWFAIDTRAYYDFGVTSRNTRTSSVRLLRFGSDRQDYSSRVLGREAVQFIRKSGSQPFFMYWAPSAPHGPSIPDKRDKGRFNGEGGTRSNDKMLASAYSADRQIGRILNVIPKNTVVLYMSDNGYLWGEQKVDTNGQLTHIHGKQWPYDESIRIPIVIRTPSALRPIQADASDIVANVDIRQSLTSIAGIKSVSPVPLQGLDWYSRNYTARKYVQIGHYKGHRDNNESRVETYCGAREVDLVYIRYRLSDGSYLEHLFTQADNERTEISNDEPEALARLRNEARTACTKTGNPPGYRW